MIDPATPGHRPDDGRLSRSAERLVSGLVGQAAITGNTLAELQAHALEEGLSALEVLNACGIDSVIERDTWLQTICDSHRRSVDEVLTVFDTFVRVNASTFLYEVAELCAGERDPQEDCMPSDQNPPGSPYAIEPTNTSQPSPIELRTLRVRGNATPEEIRILNTAERQRLAAQAVEIIHAVGAMTTVEVSRATQYFGLRAMVDAGQRQQEAATLLGKGVGVERFRAFSDRVLEQTMSRLIGHQVLADANLGEIVVELPEFRELPPERQSFIKLIFGRLKE